MAVFNCLTAISAAHDGENWVAKAVFHVLPVNFIRHDMSFPAGDSVPLETMVAVD